MVGLTIPGVNMISTGVLAAGLTVMEILAVSKMMLLLVLRLSI